MVIAKLTVSGVSARVACRQKIPQGIVGATIELDYTDPMWAGLKKTMVFWGSAIKDVLDIGTVVTIPAEVVAKAGSRLRVGIYGVDTQGTAVIPTLWADLGFIEQATEPSLDSTTDEALPVWAQLQVQIGDLVNLQTQSKTSIVDAINELTAKTGDAGKSAYEVAVDNGFEGTEEEWLESLKGEPGQPGEPGKDGVSGVYVGPGEMPEGYNVQVDPDGDPFENIISPEAVEKAVEEYLEQNPPAQGAPGKDGADGKTPVKYVDYFTPEEVQEIAEQAAELVEVPSGGGSGTEAVFETLFDTGNTIFPAETVEIDTGITFNDLEPYKMILFEVLVPAAPWTSRSVNLQCRTTFQDVGFAVSPGNNHALWWLFERLDDSDKINFKVVSAARGNGNMLSVPPSPISPYSLAAAQGPTIFYGEQGLNGHHWLMDSPIRFRLSAATTEECTMRFVIMGITKGV